MIGKLGWLSKVALQKGKEQQDSIQELTATIQEKEQGIMTHQQQESYMEEEIK